MHQRSRYAGSGGQRTGALPVQLQEAVEHKAGAHGDADERHWAVAVQARQEHVGEQLATAHGADTRDIKCRVDKRGTVEHRHWPHRRRRQPCTSSQAILITGACGSQRDRGLRSWHSPFGHSAAVLCERVNA